MRTTTYLEWDLFLGFIERCRVNYPLVGICGAVQGYCGLRISDVMQLRWSDFDKDMIVITEKKTGKTRKITINPNLKKYMDSVYKDKCLFYHRTISRGEPILAGRSCMVVSIQYINKHIKEAFSSMGFVFDGNNSSHLFRKTFGRRVIEKSEKPEAGLILLSEVFKHSSTAITRRYLGIREEEVQNVYSMII